jgi:hypothetical protein
MSPCASGLGDSVPRLPSTSSRYPFSQAIFGDTWDTF